MIKALIQVAEVGLGLTVVYFLGSAIIHILSLGVFYEYNGLLSYFVSMFGYGEGITFALILCGIFVVMAGRWVMSWASNNGGQTPNNNGN